MIHKFGFTIAIIGILVCFSAFPVSLLVNGDEIWTQAGQAAGNKLFAYGGLIALGGAVFVLLGMFFDDY